MEGELTDRKGRCLCGAVQFAAKNTSKKVGACHCDMCRKWGGGPFFAVSCGSEINFKGIENIAVYNSSEWAERGFCRKCGSHLFYRLKQTNEHELPAGLFDDQDDFSFDLQVFVDRKPSYYSFANKTNEMTEAEVIEKFGPGSPSN